MPSPLLRRLVPAAALLVPLLACGPFPSMLADQHESAPAAQPLGTAPADGARAGALALAPRSGEAASEAVTEPGDHSPWPFGLDVRPPDLRPYGERQWANAADVDGITCREALKSAGVKFQKVADAAAPDKHGCGMPHGVLVTKGATGVVYSPAIMVDCALALALVDVEKAIQEEAERELKAPIVRIRNLGGYACRHRAGWAKEKLSEHAFGSAVDLAAFEPKKGRAVSVLRDYVTFAEEATTPRARFLRNVFLRMRRGSGLTHVIGPDYNAAHRDHFHLDRGLSAWF